MPTLYLCDPSPLPFYFSNPCALHHGHCPFCYSFALGVPATSEVFPILTHFPYFLLEFTQTPPSPWGLPTPSYWKLQPICPHHPHLPYPAVIIFPSPCSILTWDVMSSFIIFIVRSPTPTVNPTQVRIYFCGYCSLMSLQHLQQCMLHKYLPNEQKSSIPTPLELTRPWTSSLGHCSLGHLKSQLWCHGTSNYAPPLRWEGEDTLSLSSR